MPDSIRKFFLAPSGQLLYLILFYSLLVNIFLLFFQKRSRDKARLRHDDVMKLLVRRYVCEEQRKRDDFGITEDDVMEIRQDISTLRYDLIDIFKTNGMKTPRVAKDNSAGCMINFRILIKTFQLFDFFF